MTTSTKILLVVAVLLVLFAAIDWHIGQDQSSGKITTAKTQIVNFGTALDVFEKDVGRYPSTEEGLRALVVKPDSVGEGWTQPYIPKLPLNPWRHEYRYESPGTHNSDTYDLWSSGPDGKSGTEDDLTNWAEEQAVRPKSRPMVLKPFLLLAGTLIGPCTLMARA